MRIRKSDEVFGYKNQNTKSTAFLNASKQKYNLKLISHKAKIARNKSNQRQTRYLWRNYKTILKDKRKPK